MWRRIASNILCTTEFKRRPNPGGVFVLRRRGMGGAKRYPSIPPVRRWVSLRSTHPTNLEHGSAVPKIRPHRQVSITRTERPRSTNLLQMPRGLMCKLRQCGRDYGGPAGPRGIDPSLQPCSRRSNCLGGPPYGRAGPSRRPSHVLKINHNSGSVCPAPDIGVALFRGLFRFEECPISFQADGACWALNEPEHVA